MEIKYEKRRKEKRAGVSLYTVRLSSIPTRGGKKRNKQAYH